MGTLKPKYGSEICLRPNPKSNNEQTSIKTLMQIPNQMINPNNMPAVLSQQIIDDPGLNTARQSFTTENFPDRILIVDD